MTDQPLEQLRQIRIEKLTQIRNLGINPYPATILRKQSIIQVRQMMDQDVAIAGRIRSIRGHGNLYFLDLEDSSAKIQIMLRKDLISDSIFTLVKLLDIGDFVAIQGKVITSKTGEITVEVLDLQIASKSLRPLPDSWYGLKDVEERYRHRYVDMILNPEVREKIVIRSNVVQKIREFLLGEGFLEVETPILEITASGALANPFLTHIKAYDMDLFLRICMGELWQKKLMIAGFEKTFEIGRAFRNEGVDREHNPEFTMMEYYYGYADYKINMEMQERLMAFVVKEVTGSYVVKVGEHEINFEAPYPRRTFVEIIKEKTNLDILAYQTLEELQKAMQDYGFRIDPKWGKSHLIDEFYKEYVRPNLIQPVFVTHHPKDLKPLAKEDPDMPGYTQSFQLLASGFELSNNYSELNDPIDQLERFNKQKELDAAGDDETMTSDEEFVEALEYGMPPVSGTGIGIDRFVSLLTNSHHIREVIAFPLMKPKESHKKQVLANKKIQTRSPIVKETGHKVVEIFGDLPNENSKRFVVILNAKIETGKLMNALGHITAGLVANVVNTDEACFLDYSDKGGQLHAKLSHYPFIILKADNSNQLKTLRKQLKERGINFFDFTDTMTIGTSVNQIKATSEKDEEEFEYYGVCFFGLTEQINELTKKFSLYK